MKTKQDEQTGAGSAAPTGSPARLKLENDFLWAWVKCVWIEDDCRCGNPPYDNGNPCPKCMAHKLLEHLGRAPENAAMSDDAKIL